ncbi:MAG TPA: hypothetical protein VLJ10_01275, partial [Candidatus Bathyarchaeia archaeon]|nr:hypothetical protein [Candidatus Bathyarchaeia archaeon]
MVQATLRSRHGVVCRVFSTFLTVVFSIGTIYPPQMAQAQVLPMLPLPGTMVTASPGYIPALIKGITIHPENPLQFDFIVDNGHSKLHGQALEDEALTLIKYFLASLTVPENELWVNLSPYESGRVISEGFGKTEMGMNLLAQDYILKQLTASLVYPENETGKKFWDKVRARAQKEFGTTDISMDNFHKVWIVPQDALVMEDGNSAYVIESRLRVMMEEDYHALRRVHGPEPEVVQGLAARVNAGAPVPQDPSAPEKLLTGEPGNRGTGELTKLQTEIMREIILPEIEKEVNEGQNFAQLRQIYQSLILATWFKKTLKESLLGQVYVDRNKVKGVDTDDPALKQKIYDQYVKAFEQGVYNYIKEEVDPVTNQVVPRQYFSGGLGWEKMSRTQRSVRKNELRGRLRGVAVQAMKPAGTANLFGINVVENLDEEQQGELQAQASSRRGSTDGRASADRAMIVGIESIGGLINEYGTKTVEELNARYKPYLDPEVIFEDRNHDAGRISDALDIAQAKIVRGFQQAVLFRLSAIDSISKQDRDSVLASLTALETGISALETSYNQLHEKLYGSDPQGFATRMAGVRKAIKDIRQELAKKRILSAEGAPADHAMLAQKTVTVLEKVAPQALTDVRAGLFTPEQTAVLDLVVEVGQEHTVALAWQAAGNDGAKKKAYLDQVALRNQTYPTGLKGYAETHRQKLTNKKAGKNPYAGMLLRLTKKVDNSAIDARYWRAMDRGIEAAGDMVIMLAQGGVGDRLAWKTKRKIKTDLTMDPVLDMSYMERFIRDILAIQEAANERRIDKGLAPVQIPYVHMVSGQTADGLQKYFADNNNFGMNGVSFIDVIAGERAVYDRDLQRVVIRKKDGQTRELGQLVLFRQEDVFASDNWEGNWVMNPPPTAQEIEKAKEEGKTIEPKTHLIMEKGHNHGDLNLLMHMSGLARAFADAGKKHVMYHQDTNAETFRAAIPALGNMVDNGKKLNIVVVPIQLGEKAGSVVYMSTSETKVKEGAAADPKMKKEFIRNVEYSDIQVVLGDENVRGDLAKQGVKPEQFNDGNINVFVMDIATYANVLEKNKGLVGEEIVNRKAETGISRLEAMVQDVYIDFEPVDVIVNIFNSRFVFSAAKNSVSNALIAVSKGLFPENITVAIAHNQRNNRILLNENGDVEMNIDAGDTLALPGEYKVQTWKKRGEEKFFVVGWDGDAFPAADGWALTDQKVVKGIPYPTGAHLSWTPDWARTADEVREKWQGGRIDDEATVGIKGKNIFFRNVQVEGSSTLIVKANPDQTLTVENLKVNNAGWRYRMLTREEALDKDTGFSEFERMWGFRVLKDEQMVIDLTSLPAGNYRVNETGVVSLVDAAMLSVADRQFVEDLFGIKMQSLGALLLPSPTRNDARVGAFVSSVVDTVSKTGAVSSDILEQGKGLAEESIDPRIKSVVAYLTALNGQPVSLEVRIALLETIVKKGIPDMFQSSLLQRLKDQQRAAATAASKTVDAAMLAEFRSELQTVVGKPGQRKDVSLAQLHRILTPARLNALANAMSGKEVLYSGTDAIFSAIFPESSEELGVRVSDGMSPTDDAEQINHPLDLGHIVLIHETSEGQDGFFTRTVYSMPKEEFVKGIQEAMGIERRADPNKIARVVQECFRAWDIYIYDARAERGLNKDQAMLAEAEAYVDLVKEHVDGLHGIVDIETRKGHLREATQLVIEMNDVLAKVSAAIDAEPFDMRRIGSSPQMIQETIAQIDKLLAEMNRELTQLMGILTREERPVLRDAYRAAVAAVETRQEQIKKIGAAMGNKFVVLADAMLKGLEVVSSPANEEELFVDRLVGQAMHYWGAVLSPTKTNDATAGNAFLNSVVEALSKTGVVPEETLAEGLALEMKIESSDAGLRPILDYLEALEGQAVPLETRIALFGALADATGSVNYRITQRELEKPAADGAMLADNFKQSAEIDRESDGAVIGRVGFTIGQQMHLFPWGEKAVAAALGHHFENVMLSTADNLLGTGGTEVFEGKLKRRDVLFMDPDGNSKVSIMFGEVKDLPDGRKVMPFSLYRYSDVTTGIAFVEGVLETNPADAAMLAEVEKRLQTMDDSIKSFIEISARFSTYDAQQARMFKGDLDALLTAVKNGLAEAERQLRREDTISPAAKRRLSVLLVRLSSLRALTSLIAAKDSGMYFSADYTQVDAVKASAKALLEKINRMPVGLTGEAQQDAIDLQAAIIASIAADFEGWNQMSLETRKSLLVGFISLAESVAEALDKVNWQLDKTEVLARTVQKQMGKDLDALAAHVEAVRKQLNKDTDVEDADLISSLREQLTAVAKAGREIRQKIAGKKPVDEAMLVNQVIELYKQSYGLNEPWVPRAIRALLRVKETVPETAYPLKHAAQILFHAFAGASSFSEKNAMLMLLPAVLAYEYQIEDLNAFNHLKKAIELYAAQEFDEAETELTGIKGVDQAKARQMLDMAQEIFNRAPKVTERQQQVIAMWVLAAGRSHFPPFSSFVPANASEDDELAPVIGMLELAQDSAMLTQDFFDTLVATTAVQEINGVTFPSEFITQLLEQGRVGAEDIRSATILVGQTEDSELFDALMAQLRQMGARELSLEERADLARKVLDSDMADETLR